ncbi:uncharacterized protein LOC131944827 isoform X2 [Physella acuta]|uniref:uncharacterized protein LOC131944827 isoform X2 n=1 Tax=Physella acuta TaxID=109671 RepID=UPI0027DBE7AD|nr:uncharacterized protein LOC131944827 isoform X2 [Physella acuta]
MMVTMFYSILLFWFFTNRPQSTTATTITTLFIGWTAQTSQEPETLARYRIYLSPYTSQPQTSPARNWTFAFTGSQQGTSDTPNNRNTMKIEMVVYDAKCADAGVYYCNAGYIDFQGDVVLIKQYQNISSYARVDPLSLILVPQFPGQEPGTSVNPAGSNLTLTCNLYGPKVIVVQWKYGHSSSDVNSFTSYPLQNDITVAEPVLVSSGTTCVQYRHTSTLKFQTEDMYDGYMYVCVATEDNRDTIVGYMTIFTKPSSYSSI